MKQKMSIGAKTFKPKDLSRNHYTTLGFGNIYPIFVEETIPKDKFNIKVSNFSRLAAQYLPNLGTLNMKLHAFYVPFRLVWSHYENFVEGLPCWISSGQQVYKNVPIIDNFELSRLVSEYCTHHTSLPKEGFDFAYDYNGTEHYYTLKKQGKYVYHVLCSLGYNFQFAPLYDGIYQPFDVNYSLMPLLCWFKMYVDYFIPSQLQPSSYIHQLFNFIHNRSSADLQKPIQYGYLKSMFDELYYYYQNNYFTSAWMTPYAPVTGLNNNMFASANTISQINSESSQVEAIYSDSNGVMSLQQTDYDFITPDGLSLMQKFARYIKRSNFAGSRSIERILAKFGVRVDDFQIGMSKYLGSDSITLQKSDVTVTGNTDQAGDFAGKAWFASNKEHTFKCDCDFAGMIFVTASIETPSTYVDGVRRRNLHIYPFDFYNPDFDGTLMQAISGQEVFSRMPYLNSDIIQTLDACGLMRTDVFGFTPRYSEYKMALDDVSGDFALPRFAANIDSFILPRRLFDMQGLHDRAHIGDLGAMTLTEVAYSQELRIDNKITPTGSLFGTDMVQFNRIFRDTDGLSDPIFSVFQFDVVVHSVSLPLNVSAELIGRGKVLDFETNGVHV